MTDSEILRQAVVILRRESSKPNGFWMSVLYRTLLGEADRLAGKATTTLGNRPTTT